MAASSTIAGDRRRAVRVWGVVALILTGLAACAAQGAEPDPGARYLAVFAADRSLVTEGSALICEIEGADGRVAAVDWPAIRRRLLPWARRYAASVDRERRDLAAQDWPSDARKPIRELEAELRLERQHWLAVARTTSFADFIAISHWSDAPDSAVADEARRAMGLPPTPQVPGCGGD